MGFGQTFIVVSKSLRFAELKFALAFVPVSYSIIEDRSTLPRRLHPVTEDPIRQTAHVVFNLQ
jgi:hypothetical protein